MYDVLVEREIPPFRLVKKIVKEGTVLDFYDSREGRIYKGKYPHDFPIVVLEENGEVWMSDTPLEQEGIAIPVTKARGNVLTSGLGLGLFPYLIRRKRGVRKIDIVEKEQKVIDLVFDQIRTPKMEVFQDDIYQYLNRTERRYDFIYLDIWAAYVGPIKDVDKATEAAQRVLAPGGEIRVWLQELIDRVKRELPRVPTPPSPPAIYPPCLICGKTLRHDYAGVCMDCADTLGISELFMQR